MLLCRWSANFASLFVVYYRIEQISRLNLACAVFFKVKLTIISTHRHVIVTVPLMNYTCFLIFKPTGTLAPGGGKERRCTGCGQAGGADGALFVCAITSTSGGNLGWRLFPAPMVV